MASVSDESYAVTDIDVALKQIQFEENKIFFVGFGVSWFLPAQKSLELLSQLKDPEIGVFAIDEEQNKEFCEEHGIVVGSPALMVYIAGRVVPIKIARYDTPQEVLHGPLNSTLLSKLVEASKNYRRQLFSDESMKANYITLDW